mmetsp:Transcript_6219/g.17748  ORF Transcript_6219/g.17748 Transcript_6219/m.17748 type:complete len:274 (+) Transcript_6219:29-850(+)
MLALCLAFAAGASALVALPTPVHVPIVSSGRRVSQLQCVAATEEEKTLLAASKKVTLAAKRFGVTQGKQAQAWVEQAVSAGDASASGLMEMQLTLFEECQLDDESGRCKALTEAIEALSSAVEVRRNAPKDKEFELILGPTAIQEAATKLRASAATFGPEQKEAANVWIKKLTSGEAASGAGLLEEQITLFGECVLSEGSTPSNCQLLEEALCELQAAIDSCQSEDECEPKAVAEAVADELVAAPAPAVEIITSGRKRKAVKQFLKKLVGKAN